MVHVELPERNRSSYQRAADFINLSPIDLLCIQPEFGIFGGPAGSDLLPLRHRLRLAVVTTLHTVPIDGVGPMREYCIAAALSERATRMARAPLPAAQGVARHMLSENQANVQRKESKCAARGKQEDQQM